MPILRRLESHRREHLVDVTHRGRAIVREADSRDELVARYARGATATVVIPENRGPASFVGWRIVGQREE